MIRHIQKHVKVISYSSQGQSNAKVKVTVVAQLLIYEQVGL